MKSYPLLQSQFGVLLQSMQHPESTQYNLPNYTFMPLALTMERIVRAVHIILQSFPELHTRFVTDEHGEIRQWCDLSMPIPVTSRKCSEAELQTYINDGFIRPFNLFGNEPLFRAEVIETEKSLCLLTDGHHAIIDGMSFVPIISKALARILEGGTIEVPSYGMYQAAEDEVASFGTPLYLRAKDYYAQKFAGLEMATLSHSPYGTMGAMGRKTTTVSKKVCDDWCREHGVQVNLLFQAAFSHVISVLTRQQQVAYATVNHGRMDKRLRGCVGMFVKTVPIMVNANPSQRVVDFVKSLRSELMSTIRYGIYPFTHFCSDLGMKPGIMFDFLAVADMEEHMMLSDGEIRAGQPVRKEIDSDINVDIYLKDNSYEIRVESSLAMNDANTLRMVAEAVKVAVCNMIAHPDATLGELDIVSDEEREALIQLGTGKHLDIDPQMTFVKAFEACAHKNPDRLAVADATDNMTYSELSRRSNMLAHHLIESGVKPGDFVAIMLDRTIDFPLAVIAIHKAGAAYVPIDLEYPEERKKYILDDCQAKVIIDSEYLSSLNSQSSIVTFRSSESRAKLNRQSSLVNGQSSIVNRQSSIDLSTPDGLAYMIYTSGSTGRPKGVMIGQSALWNFVNTAIHAIGLTTEDRVGSHFSFSFDGHVEDIFPILTLGGSVHIMPTEIRQNLESIKQFLTNNNITYAGFTTPVAVMMLNTYGDDLPIRIINSGGEKMPPAYSDRIRIINSYGPTECTCVSSYYTLPRGVHIDNVPIGRPALNSYYFLTDPMGRLVPRGVIGELCFASQQVARGYWQQPEQTAEKFIDCPFSIPQSPSSILKMYRTGDLCRWNADGQMEYIGRIDSQIKLRGYRIELGEVETCAAHFEGIKQAVAVVRPVAGSDALCLYYTTVPGVTAIDTDELSRFMSRLLADYMVPAAYMQLDTLPLMPNGKVDRRQLPEPLPAAHADYVAPQTKTEDTLARLTGDVLSSSKPISMADNFFALGGDSIKIIRLVSLLRNEGYTAQVSELMQCSTLLDMASILVSCNEGSSISQEPVVGTVMPGAIQQCFLSWHLSQPGRFTQSVVLRASQPIDATCLQQVLQVLVVHHDMLRAKVNDNNNENRCIYIRSITDDHLFALREVILPAQTDVAQAIAQASNDEGELIDLQHGPLLRVVLLHTEDGDSLLMVCHHIACDGVSWRIITEDLSTALTQLSKGQSISLPPKTHSFGYWTNTIARYRDSYLLSQEKPYWQRVQALMENMELTRTHDGNQVKQHLTVTLEGEPLRHLLSTSAKAYNTEINDLLITALCQAYYRQTGNTNLTIQMEGHGREPLHESVVTDRTVGWFTSVYPLVINGISGDVHNDVRQVKELLRAVPNKGIGYGILQYISSQEMDDALRVDLTPLVGFNYLGEAVSSSKGTLFTVDSSFLLSESLTSGQLGVPTPSIDINCTVVEGRFIALFEYDTACWTSERAQQLADGFVDSIIQVAEHTANVAIPDPTASDFGAVGWTEKQFQNIISHFESRGERLQRVYPLTPMQEGMLVTYLTNRETTAYRLVTRLSMSMLPTEARLRNTLDYLAEKHEVLRTAILYDSVPNPCQTIVSRRLGLEMHDLTNEPDIEAAATRIHQEELHRPLSLTDDPLFRLVCMKTGDNSCQLIVFMHHIITDGWCLPIIFSDFLMKMEAESSQQISDSSTPTLTHPRSYETFVRQLLRRDRKAGLAYWKNLLAGYDTRAAIPSYGKPAGTEAKPFIRHTLDEALTASLRQLAAKTGVTLNTVMELGWGLVLQTFCRTNDAVFLRVVSGRDNSDSDNSQLVGMFINSVPVRVHTIGTETIASSLQSLQEQAAQSAYYDFCPLSDIQQRTGLGTSLYQSVMAFENYPLSETLSTAGRQWAIKPVQIEEEAFGELSITISPETNGTLRLTFTYDTSLYGEQQMQQVADTFETIVRNMAAMPDGQLRELSLVTEEARNELIELGTGKHIDIAPHMTFVKAFERRASQHPDNLAVADASDSLTYGELLRRSNILAHRLIESGIKPGDFVAVMLDRTIDYPLAVLAIHKAGAAYVPIDLEYPEERQQYMLCDCQAKVVIDNQFMAETDFCKETDSVDLSSPDGLAYMIYTSGSTGKPKGVMIRQGGLSSYIASMVDVLELTSADRISLHRPFSFDAHIQDLYPVLTVGGSVHIMPSEILRDIQGMRDFIASHGITGGSYTTSLGKLLIGSGRLPLRYISLTGERMADLVSDDVQLFNGYGPTECTDLISIYRLERGRSYSNIPIGRPMANGHCFIVDSYGRLVPRGAEGELCFASVQVSAGYWNLPELTAEKFVDCPFILHPSSISPLKMYRTGDLCRWNDEGLLEFLDRVDSQVKLRGYRIELGEIEACACQFAGINQVVAQAINGQYICLYYSADTDVDVNALKQHLANRLAAYMIPTAYMQLDAMPLNANGKIDRHQLPEPSTIVRTEGLLPQTEKEAVLLLVAQQVLERDDFGITDDLFDLGLTSITAIKVAAMAEAFGMHISVNNLQRLRTIKRVFNIETPIGYWFNNYSPEKPVLISPHGVVPVISMTEKFMVWQEHFSIYTFEPTDEHASRISPNMDYEKLVNAYADLLERDIPTDAHVFGFLGYSWGGELGYSLAARWQERHGGKPNVYLCDTFIFDPDVPKKTEEEISQGMVMYLMTHEADFDMSGLQQADSAQNGDVLNMILMKCGKDAGFAGEVLKIATKKFYYGELYRRVRPLPTTDCRVTYFIATRENPHMEDTLASWQKVAPAMNVIEIDDNHMNFSLRNDKTYMVTKCLLDDLKSELLNKKMSEE